MNKSLLYANLVIQPISIYIYYRLWEISVLTYSHLVYLLANVILILFLFPSI